MLWGGWASSDPWQPTEMLADLVHVRAEAGSGQDFNQGGKEVGCEDVCVADVIAKATGEHYRLTRRP